MTASTLHASTLTYLDHAASSPQRPEVTAVMAELAGLPGNPSATHAAGRRVRARVEEAREELAAAIGAHPTEIVFTSGGTEADNLAVLGAHAECVAQGAPVVTTPVEHAAVARAVAHLAGRGIPVHEAALDEGGQVDRAAWEEALCGAGPATLRGAGQAAASALATVAWVQNETGVAQGVPALAEVARRHGAVVHSDAVQAIGHVPVDFAASGLDLLSLAGHKVGGPQGVGALVVRRGVRLAPIGFGGGQEARVRSGTVPVALVAGLAAAVRVAVEELADEGERVRGLRDEMEARVLALDPGIRVTGAGAPRASHIAHLTIEGCRSEDLLFLLDAQGVCVSGGSACSAGVTRPSPVLLAMGHGEAEAESVLRVSLGWSSTPEDVERLVAVLPEVVERARAAARV